MSVRPTRLDIYRTAIPMRGFEHAAASRDVAEAVVVRMELSGGAAGWGETLPREYVTGETIETVVAALSDEIWPALAAGASGVRMGDRRTHAAACAAELAYLDALSAGGWGGQAAELLGGAAMRGRIDARVSGVLGSADPSRTAWRLRLMRWYGLRDFKLKLGFGDDVDAENLRVVHGRIGRAVAAGRCTFRVDVNGGWDAGTAPERAAALRPFGVCVVEQPVFCPAAELAELARRCELPLMADESLLDEADARELLGEPRRVWWNVRISKNGGLARALSLAETAAEAGVGFTIGCMVGESGILSAAQRRLLELAPRPRFVEGNYGLLLLSDDLARPSLRFGYGGRLKALRGGGLGVAVDSGKVARYGQLVRSLRA